MKVYESPGPERVLDAELPMHMAARMSIMKSRKTIPTIVRHTSTGFFWDVFAGVTVPVADVGGGGGGGVKSAAVAAGTGAEAAGGGGGGGVSSAFFFSGAAFGGDAVLPAAGALSVAAFSGGAAGGGGGGGGGSMGFTLSTGAGADGAPNETGACGGDSEGEPRPSNGERVGDGGGGGAEGAAPNGAPQLLQKRASSRLFSPHFGHCIADLKKNRAGYSTALPQPSQNFASAGSFLPHPAHVRSSGFVSFAPTT